MRIFSILCLLCLLAFPIHAEETQFGQFAVTLPPGWDGEEQVGFVSNNDAEYALTLGRKDDSGDTFLAQVSIFLLPNRPGVDAKSAASTLADAQGDASEPLQVGNFWEFTGEPRSRIIKGMSKTRVNADKDFLLIIIAQDPQNLGADDIVASLRGLTPQASQLLGR